MADAPSLPWTLACSWCPYSLLVSARGARGRDPGSGVEAARLMKTHVEREHGKTWGDWLADNQTRKDRTIPY